MIVNLSTQALKVSSNTYYICMYLKYESDKVSLLRIKFRCDCNNYSNISYVGRQPDLSTLWVNCTKCIKFLFVIYLTVNQKKKIILKENINK